MRRIPLFILVAFVVILGMFYRPIETTEQRTPAAPELTTTTTTTTSDTGTDDTTVTQPKSPFANYLVRPGDTLSGIAVKHNTDVQTVAYANGISANSVLQVGRTLLVPLQKGAVHIVRRGDTLWDIARAYGVTVTTISEANPTLNPSTLKVNDKLLIPGAKPGQTQATSQPTNSFSWPANGRITSSFGPRWGKLHAGIDLGLRTGTPIRAARAGTVTFSGWSGGYGYLVKISHGNGYETRYAHNSRLVVKAGDKVAAGQLVAYSGSTGNSTGPHLHFEIRVQGVAKNPRPYLP